MRSLDAALITSWSGRSIIIRHTLLLSVRNRDDDTREEFGFSNLRSTKDISVIDGRTGVTSSKQFVGLGSALYVGNITLTTDITIRTLNIKLSGTDTTVNDAIRGYDPRGAPCQVHRLYLDVDTNALIASPTAWFIGYVDNSPIKVPRAGEIGSIDLKCVSTTRELTRTNSEVRSHESQLLRSPTDDFYKDVGVVDKWEMFWGANSGVALGSDKPGGARTGDKSGGPAG